MLYARAFAERALGHDIDVRLAVDKNWSFRGAYGDRVLTINWLQYKQAALSRPGSPEFEPFDALLIHELAHAKVSDHLSPEYHQELCRLGAKLHGFCVPPA